LVRPPWRKKAADMTRLLIVVWPRIPSSFRDGLTYRIFKQTPRQQRQ
jgi:hypothetical protein